MPVKCSPQHARAALAESGQRTVIGNVAWFIIASAPAIATIGPSAMPLTRRTVLLGSLALAGCVYRVDVQQGNLLDDEAVEAVQIGMTRSQVRFLLGTPMVEDAFHKERWDYVYYFRRGHSRREEKRWLIVTFADDKVTSIRKDVPFDQPG